MPRIYSVYARPRGWYSVELDWAPNNEVDNAIANETMTYCFLEVMLNSFAREIFDKSPMLV